MLFRVERSLADVRDGDYGAVRLLLFERAPNPLMQASQSTSNGRELSATASNHK